jgi:hypothetical protein
VPRELRQFVPIELVCVLATAIALPPNVPVALPLVVVAALSRWSRGRGFAELVALRGSVIAVATVGGAVAAAIAAPAFAAFGVTAIEPWLVPADSIRLALALAVAIANAVALELALRGWIIERFLELSPGPARLPIIAAALAEAIVLPEPIAARIGAGLFSAGLGLIYIAAGRNVLAPIVARCTFAAGCIVAALA